MLVSVDDILHFARLSTTPYAGANGVLLSPANQILGTYANLKRFQGSKGSPYRGWQAHHIVEKQDLDRLGIANRYPSPDDQICVLLPERAHIGRINSILRNHAPIGPNWTQNT